MSLADRLAAFARTPTCRSVSLSPDGERVALVSNLGGVPQAWTVAARGGWPVPLTALDDPVRGVMWSPDGRWLALTVAPGGGVRSQVHVVRPDGTGLRRLTAGGGETNVRNGWSRDGRLLLATSERSGAGMDVLLVDPDTGRRRHVADLGGVGRLTDVSPDGRHAVIERVRQRGDSDVVVVGLESGGEVALTPHAGPATNGSACFSPDGRWVYLASDVDRDRVALVRVDLARALAGRVCAEVVAARPDAELTHVAAAPDRRLLALCWNAGGACSVELVDPVTGRLEPGPAAPAEVVTAASLSAGGRRVAILATGAAMPPNVWVWERGRPPDDLVQVTRLAPAGIALDGLTRPELVRFPAHDGLELSGWLYRAAAGPGPVVLDFHGGPQAQELPEFSGRFQGLLEAGIGVLAPNVRGSSGFGRRFAALDDGPLRFDAVRDIAACAAFLLREGIARPGRLGIMGGSYGGFMAAAGITEHPDLFAAACVISGIVNFETYFAHTEPWRAAVSRTEYGDPERDAALLRRLSPIHRIDRVRAPALVIHGANDTSVPVIEAEQMVDALRRRDVPCEYLCFPDEGHGLQRTANVVTATEAIVRWFRTHLAR